MSKHNFYAALASHAHIHPCGQWKEQNVQ